MRNIIFTVIAVAMLSIPTVAQAGTMGCLLGAAAGGFGGAQIGSGNGQLAAVGAGTLLGCGIGSSIQNSNQQRQYQPRYQPQPRYQQVQSIYSYQRPTRRYYQPAPVQWQQPRPTPRPVTQNTCPYSREYQDTVTIGGKQVLAYGTACSYNGGSDWDLGPLTPAR